MYVCTRKFVEEFVEEFAHASPTPLRRRAARRQLKVGDHAVSKETYYNVKRDLPTPLRRRAARRQLKVGDHAAMSADTCHKKSPALGLM